MTPFLQAFCHRQSGLAVAVGIIALTLQGCTAPLGMAMVEIGAGTGASAGVNHTLSGITYKTFTAPSEDVHAATLKALEAMDIPVDSDAVEDKTRKIKAHATDRDIGIEVEAVTDRTTRLRVVASEDVIFKDSSTATEIILQSAQALDDMQAERSRAHARRVASRSRSR